MSRLHPQRILPSSLWRDEALHVPAELCSVYERQLANRMLLDRAREDTALMDIYGGPGLAETLDHFACRYATSACRHCLALLDPSEQLDDIPEKIVRALTDGKVALLDAPSGAGASSAALLSAIAELRRERILPCLPLKVYVLAADLSQPALDLFTELMTELTPALRRQFIEVSFSTSVWDVNDPSASRKLMDDWFRLADAKAEHWLLWMGDFSGSLGKQKAKERARDGLMQLYPALYDREFTAIWVEPENDTSRRLHEWLLGKLLKVIPAFLRLGADIPSLATRSKMWHPIQLKTMHCSLRVMACKSGTRS